MATVALTAGTFERTISDNSIVLVNFQASWRGPYRQFAPAFEEPLSKNPGIVLTKVDTDAEQDLARVGAITSIPTLMVFRDGIVIFRQAGALSGPALEDLISQICALDMDEIHKQITESER